MREVVWLSLKPGTPARGYWDQALLERVFQNDNHQFTTLGLDSATVIIPGAYQADYIEQINDHLSRLRKCDVIITSDEEAKFPIAKLKHQNMRIFATYAYEPTGAKVNWLPIGPPPQSRLIKKVKQKDYDWCFMGQVNHPAREQMIEQIKNIPNGKLVISEGFAQGLDHQQYYDIMSRSKVVFAPPGNVNPDSFRTYEAIESGAIPIVQNRGFWKLVFGAVPFPVVSTQNSDWTAAARQAIENYQILQPIVNAWWITTKQQIKQELKRD